MELDDSISPESKRIMAIARESHQIRSRSLFRHQKFGKITKKILLLSLREGIRQPRDRRRVLWSIPSRSSYCLPAEDAYEGLRGGQQWLSFMSVEQAQFNVCWGSGKESLTRPAIAMHQRRDTPDPQEIKLLIA